MSHLAIEAPRTYRVATPEGISLPFEVASAGDRLGAFLLDFALILLGTLATGLFAGFLLAPLSPALALAFFFLATFFLFNFYFVAWEIGRSGVTPGKRRLGLRVISRDGGPLTADAVFARNLTRDLELLLPLAALTAPQTLVPAAPGWGTLLAVLWLLVFAFLPLLSKDRLRCGDLVAGTIVVRAPAALLLYDLAQATPAIRLPAAGAAEIAFTREQLDIYGIHELQILEDLLRRDDAGTLDPRLLAEVADKIKRKIAWPAEQWEVPVRPFLTAFYRAQRGRLEQRMLFGERRERKKG